MSSNKTETVSLTETIIWFMLWLLKYVHVQMIRMTSSVFSLLLLCWTITLRQVKLGFALSCIHTGSYSLMATDSWWVTFQALVARFATRSCLNQWYSLLSLLVTFFSFPSTSWRRQLFTWSCAVDQPRLSLLLIQQFLHLLQEMVNVLILSTLPEHSKHSIHSYKHHFYLTVTLGIGEQLGVSIWPKDIWLD